MKITKIEAPFPAVSIDDFIPSPALVRSAAESFSNLESDDWVKYESNSGQVQYCSKVPRKSTPESLFVMDYIATHFDPSKYFEEETEDVFPDLSHYGGGMMLTPNTNGMTLGFKLAFHTNSTDSMFLSVPTNPGTA